MRILPIGLDDLNIFIIARFCILDDRYVFQCSMLSMSCVTWRMAEERLAIIVFGLLSVVCGKLRWMSGELFFSQPELTRRQFCHMALGSVALTAAARSGDEVPILMPNSKRVPGVEVVASNIALVAPERPDALVWTPAHWASFLNEVSYEGMEVHRFTTEAAPFLGASVTALVRLGMVRSFHQSIRGDGTGGLIALLLPTTSESIGQLHAEQEAAGSRKYPFVAFPEANSDLVQDAVRAKEFASVCAQPTVGLFGKSRARSMRELRQWLVERGMKVCWASFHCQESAVFLDTPILDLVTEDLPQIAGNGSSELEEAHLEIGRIDGSSALRDATMHELIAFIDGPEAALKTVSGKMLQTIFQHTPVGERPRVVVEVNQAGLSRYLGARSLWPLMSPIIDSHRRIVQTVRDLASVRP